MRALSRLLAVAALLAGPAAAAADQAALLADAAQLEHGEGMAQDLPLAAALYCQAARAGAPEGQYALGWMVANGRGLARDDGMAWRLFTLAASQGHPQAARMAQLLPARPDAALPDCMNPPAQASRAPAAPLAALPPALPAAPPIFTPLGPPLPAASAATARTAPASPAASAAVRRLVERLAPAYGVDPELALAVIAVESGFRINAVSPKNAQGLMQLIPATAQRFRVADPFDPESNVRGGLAYLRQLLTMFDGNVRLVAAAYNAGEGAVLRHGGVPPYRETIDYVTRIARLYSPPVHRYYRSSTNQQTLSR